MNGDRMLKGSRTLGRVATLWIVLGEDNGEKVQSYTYFKHKNGIN